MICIKCANKEMTKLKIPLEITITKHGKNVYWKKYNDFSGGAYRISKSQANLLLASYNMEV